ncbi:hypothetical protein TSTA_017480 [Talaromyces stipitatus ATCC 10500]|uniref:Uncharacterized protein n=1 Tax=Talaromyces stipitatus (strain ATCC 10500 / CBS 375.48 / QM 6759 / NRRL 1006) TaxID=441959 RepID=B8MFD9_TALSN|nr:uncharacterized protein TSTA_017480 [Talaromyces stipitatus ATCC 10500]EED16673.1 hypothetical protein TSTA_017480 [Talaromyces stipitatus ATCC 10500]
MWPRNVADDTTPNFAHALSNPSDPPLPPRYAQCPPSKPLTPESVSSHQAPPTAEDVPNSEPYSFEWAMDPYNPDKFLHPPKYTKQNLMWAVEFQILSSEEFHPTVIFTARLHPEYKERIGLATERLTTNEWARVVMYIPDPGLPVALCRHQGLVAVFKEEDMANVPLGPFEYRVLYGDGHSRRAQVQNITAAELGDQPAKRDRGWRGKADVKHKDYSMFQWQSRTPAPEG